MIFLFALLQSSTLLTGWNTCRTPG